MHTYLNPESKAFRATSKNIFTRVERCVNLARLARYAVLDHPDIAAVPREIFAESCSINRNQIVFIIFGLIWNHI